MGLVNPTVSGSGYIHDIYVYAWFINFNQNIYVTVSKCRTSVWVTDFEGVLRSFTMSFHGFCGSDLVFLIYLVSK